MPVKWNQSRTVLRQSQRDAHRTANLVCVFVHTVPVTLAAGAKRISVMAVTSRGGGGP